MEIINFAKARANFKSVCEKVSKDKEDVIITRKNCQSVIMINMEKYNYFMKLTEKNDYLEKIDEGISQLELGKGKEHELIEGDEHD